jgi:hypothetical protein
VFEVVVVVAVNVSVELKEEVDYVDYKDDQVDEEFQENIVHVFLEGMILYFLGILMDDVQDAVGDQIVGDRLCAVEEVGMMREDYAG